MKAHTAMKEEAIKEIKAILGGAKIEQIDFETAEKTAQECFDMFSFYSNKKKMRRFFSFSEKYLAEAAVQQSWIKQYTIAILKEIIGRKLFFADVTKKNGKRLLHESSKEKNILMELLIN